MGNDRQYDFAAAAAAELVNLYLDGGPSKSVVYQRVLFVIINLMRMSEQEARHGMLEPSDN